MKEAFPQCDITEEKGPWENFETIFQDTGETFIFILDEWDSFLHSDMFNEADRRKYLDLSHLFTIHRKKNYASGKKYRKLFCQERVSFKLFI